MEAESGGAKSPMISPEFLGPPPRRVALTGNGITRALVTAVLFAIAVIWTCFVATESARQAQIRTALRGAGNETTGEIEELRNPLHGLKEYVDYTFVADGRTYTGEAIVPLDDYHSIKSTGDLSLRYLPGDPAMNHPTDWEWSTMSEFDPYFLLSLLLGFGCIVLIPPQMQFERRLAAQGVATIGTVTKCMVSGKGGEFINLKFDFRTPDGALVQGRGSFQMQQEIGARILILYLPRRPQQNIPYPIAAWRIVNR